MMINQSALASIGYRATLPATAYRLMCGLASEATISGTIRKSVNDMAKDLDVSRVTASRALADLINAGVIERGRYQADYRFTRAFLHEPEPARKTQK